MTKLNGGHITSWPKKLAFSLGLLLAAFSIWFQIKPLWGSGSLDREGNLLFDGGAGFYDAGVHLALIQEMQSRFPPTNFAAGGAPLKNYHYLFDVLAALPVKLFGLSPFDVYFRFAPLVISFLLAAGIYLTVRQLTKNNLAAVFGIFFTVMATSFGALAPLIKTAFSWRPVYANSNLFMADQIFAMMANPQAALSLAVFLFLFLLLAAYETEKKIKWLVIFALLFGLSFNLKAHGGVVFAVAALVYSGFVFFRTRDSRPVLAVGGGLVLMAGLVFLTIDGTAVGLTFAPGWLLIKMMTDWERLNEPQFLVFFTLAGPARAAAAHCFAFALFLVGGLGLRVLGLAAIGERNTSCARVFLLAGALASLAIPLLFNQGKKPYDVVQFLPYFLLVMGIMTTVTFCKLARGRGIHVQILGLLVTITVFLFLVRGELTARLLMTDYESSPIRFESDFGFYKQGAKVVVPKDILLAAEYIRAQTPREAIFLLPPSRTNVSFLWFPALTGRRTVFSGEFFAYQVGLDTARRRQEVEDIFAGKKEGDFAYVYLDRHDLPRYGNIEQRADWRRIWGNEAAIILERVK